MGERERHDSPQHADRRDPSSLEKVTAAWEQTATALRDSERRYRELVEYSLGLLCIHDLEGTILSVNPAAAESLGYSPADAVGRRVVDFVAEDARALFEDYLRRIREAGNDSGLMRVVARTGIERVWLYRNVVTRGPEGPYVLGHAIDITERVAAERTLREREHALRAAHAELEQRVQDRTIALEHANERLRREIADREGAQRDAQDLLIRQRDTLAFLASSSERLAPVVTFDQLVDVARRLPVPFLADWTIAHVRDDNGSIRLLVGPHVDPALESSLAGIAAGPCDVEALEAVTAPDQPAMIVSNADAARDRLTALGIPRSLIDEAGAGTVAFVPLATGGRITGILSLVSAEENRYTSADAIVVHEVGRRIRLALDRIELYREAQEANRLKDEFLGTLSHELRTPLNAIVGWARILRGGDLPERVAHGIEVIERNAQAQVRLIEEVLDVSRIVHGKMTLDVAPLDLSRIVRATIDTVRPAIQARRIHLVERIEAAPIVVGDSHRLQQVFWNLLSNSIKFTNPEGTITVTLRADGEVASVDVADTGMGIRREVLPFVFDRFRQGDSAATRSHGGLGLGLAIVRHIVELHGGRVRATSPGEGHGATFMIQLPRAQREQAAPGPPAPPPDPRSPTLRGRTILVVEDDDDARDLIVMVLQGAGARVIAGSTAPQAMEHARLERLDVLVADIGLPGEDGYSLLARIRAVHPELPAIALTAYARSTDRDRALAAGFQRHLVKPLNPDQLIQEILAVL